MYGGQAHPGWLQQAIYLLACKSLSEFLIDLVLWGEQSSQMLPRFILSLFMGWPPSDILFLLSYAPIPFLIFSIHQ